MNDVTTNESLPSSVDKLGQERDTSPSGVLPISAEALSAQIDDLSERVSQLYARSNAQITRTVEPIPSLAIIALGSFIAGYFYRTLREM